jgi:putative transposase
MGKVTVSAPAMPLPEWEALEGFIREHVQRLLQSLLEEELSSILGRDRSERQTTVDAAKGYRNGYGKPRRLSTQCGTVVLRRPRARNLEERFESRVLPLFAKRTREVSELLPQLYLHGLAQNDFELALRGLLGEGAPLSSSSIERLRAKWQLEFDAWNKRGLSDRRLVYLWADGIYVKAGLEKDKAALLVVIGGMDDGCKEVLAVSTGYRESKEAWAEVFRGLRNRGLISPRLSTGDGNAGLWGGLAEVWPQSAEQRCWNHKIVNVLDQFPKKLQPEAKEMLCPIPYAPTRAEAEALRDDFVRHFHGLYPKAASTLLNDWERMVTFYDFPAPHWRHLRTTNVVESPFASVRLRTSAGKRYKKAANATALIWKLLTVAESRFQKLNCYELLPLVYMGIKFKDGRIEQRRDEPVEIAGRAA